MSEYGYIVRFHDNMEYPEGNILTVDGPAYAGSIDGADPRDAARNVLRERSDILDNTFAGLEPVFTVERNADGSFTVEVETHGLGDATIDLLRS